MRNNRAAKFIPPIVLLLLLTWFMVGCVYIPTFESADLRGAKQDFRKLTGDKKPIGIGRITREQVIALLGPPPYASESGRVFGYVIDTRQGIWVVPLCFEAHPGSEGEIGLKVVFDDQGVLQRYQVLQLGRALPMVNFNDGRMYDGGNQVIRRFNGQDLPDGELGPVLESSELLHPVAVDLKGGSAK